MSLSETPRAEIEITRELAQNLLAAQFPHIHAEFTGERFEGWDNVSLPLQGGLAVRLPRRRLAADLAEKEARWLPRIGGEWSFPAPIPVEMGEPGPGYPWRWTVVPWLGGHRAADVPLTRAGAGELGAALAQVHTPAPSDAPENPYRSLPLSGRRDRWESRLGLLRGAPGLEVDEHAVRAAFDGAPGDPAVRTWCHLDLHATNLLTRDGHLAGILDWGDLGVGDPASDLGAVKVLLLPELFDAFAREYREAGGPGDPDGPRTLAEAAYFAVTQAVIDDDAINAPARRALRSWGRSGGGHRP